jgi:hypothetical protein
MEMAPSARRDSSHSGSGAEPSRSVRARKPRSRISAGASSRSISSAAAAGISSLNLCGRIAPGSQRYSPVKAMSPARARKRLTASRGPFRTTNALWIRSGSASPGTVMRAFCSSYSPDHSPADPGIQR